MRRTLRTTSPRGAAATVLAGAATLLSACDSGQVPTDARLAVSPQERSIRITELRDADGICRTDGSRFVDVPMVLRLTTADGSPVRGADVEVYVDFAANTYSGRPVLALFEDRNGNGIVDADSELASGEGDSIARVRTGDDGAYRLLLRADIACPYRGEVFAYVGGTAATASFEVVAAETIEPEPVVPEIPAPRLPDDEGEADGDADLDPDPAPGAEPAGADDEEGASEDDGVPAQDVGDPFETVEDGGENDGSGDGDGDGVGEGASPGDGVPSDEPLDEPLDEGVPAAQPVHCVDAPERRTAVVCTVDPVPAS